MNSGPVWALKGAECTAGRGVVCSHCAALVTVPVAGAATAPPTAASFTGGPRPDHSPSPTIHRNTCHTTHFVTF